MHFVNNLINRNYYQHWGREMNILRQVGTNQSLWASPMMLVVKNSPVTQET